MNFRNTIINEILKYNYHKCSSEKLLKHKKDLKCKSNAELCKIYMKKVQPKKDKEYFIHAYINLVEQYLTNNNKSLNTVPLN